MLDRQPGATDTRYVRLVQRLDRPLRGLAYRVLGDHGHAEAHTSPFVSAMAQPLAQYGPEREHDEQSGRRHEVHHIAQVHHAACDVLEVAQHGEPRERARNHRRETDLHHGQSDQEERERDARREDEGRDLIAGEARRPESERHELEPWAKEFGATHTVNAKTDDPVRTIRTMTNGGVDYSFEAIGLKVAAEQCFDCIKPGGTATIIGMIPVGQKIELNGPAFLREKRIQGCSMGSNRFKVDMPKYVEFYREGRLRLDEMITRRGRLEDVNEAFRAMKAGEVARTVLTFE